jgi:beta-phosphoglucomutase-like phosphatase (HAD superfamily)
VTGCEVLNGKPEPDIFLKVAENLNAKPSECLVFEDSLVGVLAAKKARMTVWAIEDKTAMNQKEEIIQKADYYIQNFIDLYKN